MKTLAQLAVQYGSDKHGHHDYCQHYERHFAPFRDKECVFIEMGIGGYHYPDRGGAGLKMWRDWFDVKVKVIGFDIHGKSGIRWPNPKNFHVYQGSQNDRPFLNSIIELCGTPNIIVDDASHNNRLTCESFYYLFNKLASGGIYAIEDIESSWWENEEFEGKADYNDFKAETTINLIRQLMDDVCYKSIPNYERVFPVKAIHLYENLVFIEKE